MSSSSSSSSSSPPSSKIEGCPVDHSKFSRPSQSSPLLTPPTQQQTSLVCDSSALDSGIPTHGLPKSSAGQCPVDHTKFARESANPHASSSSSSPAAVAGPSVVGDVFPDSNPQPHQRMPLSTAPVASTIPKGGPDQAADATWIFPSPQRFFNAMTKKGWNPNEPDMAWVVSIHNTVNEQTWRKVLEYESLHSCPNPKLVRFKGRPSDLSPKARILGWFGSVERERERVAEYNIYVAPFDRHDWVVDRCGKEVRYVIDFYAGTGNDSGITLPGMPPAIHLDVRPAFTPMGAIDRLRWQLKQWIGK